MQVSIDLIFLAWQLLAQPTITLNRAQCQNRAIILRQGNATSL